MVSPRLFEIAPALLNIFSFKDQDKEEGMKRHGLQVMESIDGAIGLLDGNIQDLEDTLLELGIIHHMKNVQLDSFAVSDSLSTHALFTSTLIMHYTSLLVKPFCGR
jgi:hypothetical protein